MNKKEIALIVIVVLLSIVLVIGGTYAFYIANITGNDTAEDITIASGYLELTFDEGGSNINIEGALPTSKGSKTFTVENTSTATSPFTYNIKLAEVETTFEQKDLVYTLEEYEDDAYATLKEDGTTATGYINKDTISEDGEMYLAINIPAPAKGNKHYYKLTIEFKETNENQNYNFGKSFTGKINGDDKNDAKLYEEIKPKSLLEVCESNDPLNKCLAKGEQLDNLYADDPDNNIRYAGADEEVYNYIWFNCDDYNFTTAEEAATKNCEKWRIIGLFKNITKTAGGQEDLVKIIRDSVRGIVWDSKNKNNWTNASLKSLLEEYYNGTALSSATGIKESTKPMIEQVTWNLGGLGSTYSTAKASDWYTAERGKETYRSQPSTWDGYIGLMYPSDYGYATAGGSQIDRDACLAYELNEWNSFTYFTNCAKNDWLEISNGPVWTLTPNSSNSSAVFAKENDNSVGSEPAGYPYNVRPSIYLKSSVQIANGKGTSNEPYILVP